MTARIAAMPARDLVARDVTETPADVLLVERAGDDALPRPLRFKLLSDVELEGLPEPEPLVADVAFQTGLVALIGAYGTYKTFVLLDFAFCIATGRAWHGRTVQQGSVVFIYAEGAWGARKRLAALKTFYGVRSSVPIYFLPTSVMLTDPGQVAALLALMASRNIEPIRAVFVDTVARNMGGDESKVEDMGRFIQGCDTIRTATTATVFLAHHTGWSAERSRGSTSLPGAVDTEILIERDGDVVTLKCTKQKDAPEFQPITLQAVPVADSLAFRAFVPTRAELTKNERIALTEVQAEPGLRSTAWKDASGLAKGSYANAQRRLLALSYVKNVRGVFVATDAGRLALGTTYNSGTTQVQTPSDRQVQTFFSPLGENVVLVPVPGAVPERGKQESAGVAPGQPFGADT